ncbi:MAG TPA: hotdog domain-containing protein [Methylomirabilota bacterium]|nr:hotdog domain-containing protein [Methylomirabilota bacterium]
MPTVRDTVAEMVQYVFPQYAGAPGQIYGGRMMDWIATAGTLAASRVARGPVAVGAMDEIDFLHPVRVGEIAILRARVEYVGRTSLEVGVRVYAENAVTGERHVTLSSHLAFVAIDEAAHPRPVGTRIVPADAGEAAVTEGAQGRREARRARLASRAERAREVADETEGFRWRLEQQRFVFPEDALHGTLMFAGRLLLTVDEVAAILAVRYARAPLATASMDALEFYAPIRVGEMLTLRGALTRVGTRSMEVAIQVLAEAPFTGDVRHTCTAYLSFVKLRGAGGPLPPLAAATPVEAREREAADKRQAARVARVRALQESLAREPGSDF